MLRPWPVSHIIGLVYILFIWYSFTWFIFILLRDACTLPCY